MVRKHLLMQLLLPVSVPGRQPANLQMPGNVTVKPVRLFFAGRPFQAIYSKTGVSFVTSS